MEKCIFCKIANKTLPTDLLYEDEDVIVFRDIMPKAPIHWLVVPRQHIATLNEVEDFTLLAKMHELGISLAKQEAFAESGYRLSMNCNQQAGQEVFHIHMHVLAGKKLGSIG